MCCLGMAGQFSFRVSQGLPSDNGWGQGSQDGTFTSMSLGWRDSQGWGSSGITLSNVSRQWTLTQQLTGHSIPSEQQKLYLSKPSLGSTWGRCGSQHCERHFHPILPFKAAGEAHIALEVRWGSPLYLLRG